MIEVLLEGWNADSKHSRKLTSCDLERSSIGNWCTDPFHRQVIFPAYH